MPNCFGIWRLVKPEVEYEITITQEIDLEVLVWKCLHNMTSVSTERMQRYVKKNVCLSIYTQSTGSSRAVQDITTCQKRYRDSVWHLEWYTAVTCYGTPRLDQVDVRVLVTWG